MAKRKSDIERLQESAGQAAALLQAVGNPNRLLVLCLLIAQGEMSVGALNEAVELSPSALSQHLAKLRGDELVTYRRTAQTLHYRVADPRALKVLRVLKQIYCGDLK